MQLPKTYADSVADFKEETVNQFAIKQSFCTIKFTYNDTTSS